MKTITINSLEFLRSLNVVSPVVKDRTPLPILSNILIDVNETELKITSYNQEIRASITMKIESDEKFSFCVSKSLLHSILSSLPNIDLELSFEKTTLSISSKLGDYSLPTEDAAYFPESPNLGDLESFKVDSELFVDGIKKAIPYVDSLSENLNRVLIKSKDGKLNIAGMSRGSIYEKKFDYNGDDVEILLTTDSSKFISNTVNVDSDLSIKYNSNFFCVYFDNIAIETIQLAVKSPDYGKLFDKLQKENVLKINRELFLACIKRFSAVSDKDSKFLILEVSKDKLTLSYENDFLKHTAKENVTEFEYDGIDIRIGLHINQLKTILNTLEEEYVNVYLSSPMYPALFEETHTRILFSPMKV